MADSEEIKGLLKQAEEAQQKGEFDSAIAFCQQAIAADARSVPSYTKLAELYIAKNEPMKASEQYLIIAKAYYDSKLMKGALKHYQKVLELEPNSLEARVKLSEIYESEGMEREAKLETFKVAEAYLEKGDLPKAEQYAQKAVALKSIEARYTVGLIHFKREMIKEGVAEMEQLIKFKPNHSGALVSLGQAYLKLNRAADAVTVLEKAKSQKADDPAILEQLSLAFLAKNSPIDGLTYAIEAAEASGKQGDLDRLGRITKKMIELTAVFQKNKDIERIKTIYQKILTWDPENADVKTGLASLAAAPAMTMPPPVKSEPAAPSSPKSEPAAAPAAPTVTAGPMLKESEDMLSEADGLLKNGQYQEAINIYRVLTKKHPENMVIRQKLHQAYLLAAQDEAPGDAPKPAATQPIQPVTKKKGVKVSYL